MKFLKRISLNYKAFLFIVLNCIILNVMTSTAQTSYVLKGLGIEIGGGHNQLFWDGDYDRKELLFWDGAYDRKELSFMPTGRINYLIPIINRLELFPFLGYNEFGGRSNREVADIFGDGKLNDDIRLRNLETGIFALYNLPALRLGMGIKVNRHLSISSGFRDYSNYFGNWSYDGGIRAEYQFSSDITIGTEGWFGLNNLSDHERIEIYQNHFRILIGYRIK